MTFTDLFVRRPVLALVVSTRSRCSARWRSANCRSANIRRWKTPTITISTDYPGASSGTDVLGFVTQPIAQAVSSVGEGVDHLLPRRFRGAAW